MKNNVIETSASKVKRKQKIKKYLKLLLLILLLLLFILYIVFGVIYSRGSFSINLERDLYIKNRIIIYDDPDYKVFRSELHGKTMDFIDNIKYTWLPTDLAMHPGGSHNGENYVAYTFYIENLGENIADYWSEIIIDDAIKGVEEAIRIRVYKNGEPTTYAMMGKNGEPEIETVPFISNTLVAQDNVQNFGPGDINKYTIVLWLEGSDPECTDNILGGEIKIHMDFKSEIIK